MARNGLLCAHGTEWPVLCWCDIKQLLTHPVIECMCNFLKHLISTYCSISILLFLYKPVMALYSRAEKLWTTVCECVCVCVEVMVEVRMSFAVDKTVIFLPSDRLTAADGLIACWLYIGADRMLDTAIYLLVVVRSISLSRGDAAAAAAAGAFMAWLDTAVGPGYRLCPGRYLSIAGGSRYGSPRGRPECAVNIRLQFDTRPW